MYTTEKKLNLGIPRSDIVRIRRRYIRNIVDAMVDGKSVRILGIAETTGVIGSFETLAYQAWRVSVDLSMSYATVYRVLVSLRNSCLGLLQTEGYCCIPSLMYLSKRTEAGKVHYSITASTYFRYHVGTGYRLRLVKDCLNNIEQSISISTVDTDTDEEFFKSMFPEGTEEPVDKEKTVKRGLKLPNIQNEGEDLLLDDNNSDLLDALGISTDSNSKSEEESVSPEEEDVVVL